MKELIGNFNDLGIKRFYFEGTITTKCPECKSTINVDFEEHPLMEPAIGLEDKLIIDCDNCEKQWLLPVVLENIKVALKYNDKEMEEWT